MKKEIGLLIVFCVLSACTARKEIMYNKSECSVSTVPPEDLASNYKAFYSSSYFNVNQFEDFDKIKNGILMCRWNEGFKNATFLIVDFDKGFNAVKKRKNLTEAVILTLEEKMSLKKILGILKKESYYQNCIRDHGHASLYILEIRHNDEKIVQYYSPFNNPYEIVTSNANIELVQDIFSIMDRCYYR
ncbi:hypothetical protein [Flavobacterium chilense]|uniref:Uncharacterized protein n=1 Tax=Flavobacterium chilense TaxID=946677 RepID=A0A1M7KPZ5_9FLAO|nr:hypothetical protein [Flavobacterium chilense]SHM67511.1 hypothetical protein SAMN05444484_10878 [Flavobacterium chilense]